MGYYTELVMAIQLKRDTPTEVIEMLSYLADTFQKEKPDIKFSHPFFNTERWPLILDGDSYYLDGITNSLFEYDDISKAHYLTVRSNLKNYDNEIMHFLHWIAPYSQSGTYTPPRGHPPTGPGRSFVGYFCEPDDNSLPTLIFMREGKIYLSEVTDVTLREVRYKQP